MNKTRAKIFFFGVLALSLLSLTAYNLGFKLYLRWQASQGIWYEGKLSKTALLQVQKRCYPVIFVGSSQTQNHVDTALLARCGIDAFNLGLPGNLINEQVFSLNQAACRTGGVVVLSLDPMRLFEPMQKPRWLTMGEIIFFLRHDPKLLGDLGLPLFLRSLAMNRLDRYLERRERSLPNQARWRTLLKQKYGYDPGDDSREVNYIRGDQDRLVVLFNNGDGQVFADQKGFDPPEKILDYRNKPMDPGVLRYLAALAALAKDQGKRLVLNLAPSRANRYIELDPAPLERALPGVVVIDTRAELWPRPFWADIMHLNWQGTRLYGKILCRELKRVLGPQALAPAKRP
ncbi:MAG: hypothetical protein KQH53_05735 [Desulfarculaceae bacterium]|nr:hypothetical protein [Desulfarculaceae bacterium]